MSGEKVFQPFMVIMIFIVVGAFLLAMCSSYFISGSAVNQMGDDAKTTLGLWEYTFYDPITGYEVDNSTVLDHWPEGAQGPMPFDSNDKWVYLVRDSTEYDKGSDKVWEKYTDYIGCKRKTGSTVLDKWGRWAAPIQTFVDAFDPHTNTSRVDFTMTGKNYSIFLELIDNNTDRIWWNNYTLYMAASVLQSGNINVWSAIGMMMTAQIPNCNPIINIMVAVTIDFAIVFVAINIAMRIWSGG